MRRILFLAPLLLGFGLLFSARAAELKTLKGENYTGDILSINDKEVVIAKGGNKDDTVKVPLDQVLAIDLGGTAGKAPEMAKWTDVELNDGSVFRCTEFLVKKSTAHLTLLGNGQKIELPLASVANVLNNAQDAKARNDWDDRLAKKQTHDIVAVLTPDPAKPQAPPVVNPVRGTVGQGSEDGKSISAKILLSDTALEKNFVLTAIHGLIFKREIDPKAAPVICKVSDTAKNVIYASAVESTPAGLRLVTPAGAKIEYPADTLVKLDFSRGKLAYLSDLDPKKVVEASNTENLEHYRKDKNLNNAPISIDGKTYPKGLALKVYTELEYDLRGEYREFRTIAGIDDNVTGNDKECATILKIEGDGQKLYEKTFTRLDKKKAELITLNIKDVQRLKITVARAPNDPFDWGKHLDLGDAKVSK